MRDGHVLGVQAGAKMRRAGGEGLGCRSSEASTLAASSGPQLSIMKAAYSGDPGPLESAPPTCQEAVASPLP